MTPNCHCEERSDEAIWCLNQVFVTGTGRQELPGYVYILTNRKHTVLYTGVTSNLERRLEEHNNNQDVNSFTCRYKVKKLVYVEEYPSIVEAITREKQIKAGSRRKKVELIEALNPQWNDLLLEI